VPFFLLNGIPALAGAQPPQAFVKAFREVLGPEA
jgi:predicted DsbA family dithiol-disulfide isomerase